MNTATHSRLGRTARGFLGGLINTLSHVLLGSLNRRFSVLGSLETYRSSDRVLRLVALPIFSPVEIFADTAADTTCTSSGEHTPVGCYK